MVSVEPEPASIIERLPHFRPRPEITHVVLDFDGTLSLLRGNWQLTMRELFLELLPPLPGESRSALEAELTIEILSFNGRQPIHQMRAFAERVTTRGGRAETPEGYLALYARRLRHDINRRIHAIQSGVSGPDAFLVHGARYLLDSLRNLGFRLTLLSGTNEDFVREEATLLGLSDYFDGGIFGGTPDPKDFSKEQVYADLMRREGIGGENLLSFGDGPVEIRATAELGGAAVAVASDESANGSGRVHADKRKVLVEAGADLVIPDYRDCETLLSLILGNR
jgi:phosphoglycolate phosphatase